MADSTRLQRTGLIESLLPENGEKPFAVLTRKVIKAEMKARTPSQAGNLLSALRGMIRWMIDEGPQRGRRSDNRRPLRQGERLTRERRICAVDRRGHGDVPDEMGARH